MKFSTNNINLAPGDIITFKNICSVKTVFQTPQKSNQVLVFSGENIIVIAMYLNTLETTRIILLRESNFSLLYIDVFYKSGLEVELFNNRFNH